MHTYAGPKQEKEKASEADSLPRRKAGGGSAVQLADNRPEAKRAAQLKAPVATDAVIQKRDREAVVTWNVTHEVIPQGGSLFGTEAHPFLNEGKELHRGDVLVVDDEAIFQSRRGANQEDAKRRQGEMQGHLVNKWLKLLKVKGKPNKVDGYVRAETIQITPSEEPKAELDVSSVKAEDARAAGDTIHGAWTALRNKRRMSLGSGKWDDGLGAWDHWEQVREDKGKDTSPSWDQIEEGHDVSKNLSNQVAHDKKLRDDADEDAQQGIFKAYVKGSDAPVGIIVIEKRGGSTFPRFDDDADKKWYLQWLIGHPTAKGAGQLLLEKALKHAKDNGGTGVWVESAPSAVGWYAKQGFAPATKAEQSAHTAQDDDTAEFEQGWDSALMYRSLA
jgi:GNAT superfamily N-acetyltransferase